MACVDVDGEGLVLGSIRLVAALQAREVRRSVNVISNNLDVRMVGIGRNILSVSMLSFYRK
jgi:hypothetical protein